jgi:hypothetical protein
MADQRKSQVNFADCYALTSKRTKEFILSFLDKFVPDREEYTHTYEVPQFSDNPSVVFSSDVQLMEYLEKNKSEKHAIYWSKKKENTLRGAMCLFTSDGQIILGLYCETHDPDTSIETGYLQQIMNFCDSSQGLILYKEPAPRDTRDFLEKVKLRMSK